LSPCIAQPDSNAGSYQQATDMTVAVAQGAAIAHPHRCSHQRGRGSGRTRRGGRPRRCSPSPLLPSPPSPRRRTACIPARAPIPVRPPARRTLVPPRSAGRDQRRPVLSPPRLFPFPRIHAHMQLSLPVRLPEGRDRHRLNLPEEAGTAQLLPVPRIPSCCRPPATLLTPRAWGRAAAMLHLTVLLTTGDGNDN
jgi:hypothetical protein